MNVEIRAARPEEMDDFRRVTRYVFGDNSSDEQSRQRTIVRPEWTTCAFVGGRLASTLATYPFRMRFNGAPADVGGLTAVGTLPEQRRRGLLRRTISQSFREQRERGQSLAILWASYGGIYQRFGYGPASSFVGYEFDPRWASLHGDLPHGGVVELAAGPEEALPTMKRLYRAYSAERNLMLHRADAIWSFGVFRALDEDRRIHVAIHRDADGEPTGHLAYQVESHVDRPLPSHHLTVTDFVALDANAHVGLWRYILSHDLVSHVRMGPVSEEDPSPLLVEHPSKLGRTVREGVFARVVDAERALALRPYGDAGRVAIEIAADPLCDWNEGVFEIEADGDERRVKRTRGVPDLTLPPRSLAILAIGHASATQLARAGLLDAKDDAALRRADRMFATTHRPFCPDGF